jgi:pimeloyl-ACP methyl ester carboxylesterase
VPRVKIRVAEFYRQIGLAPDFMFSERPLIVLTATLDGTDAPFFRGAENSACRRSRILQARMRLLSRNRKQVLVPHNGHFVHLERPDVVDAAIREVVTMERRGGRPASEGN